MLKFIQLAIVLLVMLNSCSTQASTKIKKRIISVKDIKIPIKYSRTMNKLNDREKFEKAELSIKIEVDEELLWKVNSEKDLHKIISNSNIWLTYTINNEKYYIPPNNWLAHYEYLKRFKDIMTNEKKDDLRENEIIWITNLISQPIIYDNNDNKAKLKLYYLQQKVGTSTNEFFLMIKNENPDTNSFPNIIIQSNSDKKKHVNAFFNILTQLTRMENSKVQSLLELIKDTRNEEKNEINNDLNEEENEGGDDQS